jgi:tetratricopeptide (TPR) repeat protein
MGSTVVTVDRNIRFPAKGVVCFLCLLFSSGIAFAQTTFDSYLADAVKAQSAGDISGAITSYERALAIRRDVPQVWANLGLMQYQAGDHARALSSFSTAHQLGPALSVPLLFLGIENLQLNRRADAIHYLLKARQLRPTDPEVYMNLGGAYFGLKQFEPASVAYRRVTELDTNNGEAWYRLGITYLEMSEATSGELAALNRQSPFFWRLKAESLSAQDKLAESEAAFRKVLSGRYSPPCSRSSFGLVLLRRGALSDAQSEFQQEEKIGGCSLAHIGLARLAIERNEFEDALKSVASLWALDSGFIKANASELTRAMTPERITALDRTLARADVSNFPPELISVLRRSLRGGRTLSAHREAWENRGSTVLKSPEEYLRYREYSQCARSLLRITGSISTQKLSLLATCSFLTGEYETTLAAAKQLRSTPQAKEEGLFWSVLAEQRLAVFSLAYAGEVDPNSVRLHELLAESYRDRENYAEAEAEYKVALSINPDEFAALVGAAATYLQDHRIDLAHEMIQHALARNPSDPEANYVMGEILFAGHKYSDAEPYLKAGLTSKPELIPRIHALLGQVYADQGDTRRAIDEYRLGLPSDDDGSVHYQLGKVYQRTGEPRLATQAFAASKALNQRKLTAAQNAFGIQQKSQSPRD